MTAPATLRDYVARLKQAEIVPRPDGEEWAALIPRISQPGRIAAIDEETYGYFLDVLPPKDQHGGLFAFAEGAEALRLFWRQDGRHFCRQLTWAETREYCRLALIPLPH